jgi:hypothetical protein
VHSSTPTKFIYLALGLVFGAVIGWMARGPNDNPERTLEIRGETHQGEEHRLSDTTSPPLSSNQRELQDVSLPAPVSNLPRGNEAEVENDGTQIGQADSQSPASSISRRAIPVSEAHENFIRNQYTTDEGTGERRNVREILESEPIDESWSYFMEQTLQMFISNHAEASKFSIFHIECRTSMCEVQVIGFDESTASDWSRILYDMSLQPWYEFGQVGTTQNGYQGQLAILTRLTRLDERPTSTL